MGIFGLKQTVLMFLTYEACMTATYMEIHLYHTMEWLSIIIESDNFLSFQDCLCSQFTQSCTADLNCRFYNYIKMCDVSNISNVSLSNAWNFPNGFSCVLTIDGKFVFCSRRSEQPDERYRGLFHINNPSRCQLNCVEIGWAISQYATILHYPSYIKSGKKQSTCEPFSSTTRTSTKTKQTAPSTTSTSKHTSAASVATNTTTFTFINTSVRAATTQDALTAELKTDTFNGDYDESGDKVPIIVGVTISLIILIAVGLGIFFGRSWLYKQYATTRRSSPKEGQTVFSGKDANNFEKNGAQTYCNLNSDNEVYIVGSNDDYNTVSTETMDNYTVVNYSNGEFIHKNVEKPVSNVSVDSLRAQNKGENGHSSINIKFFAEDHEYSSTDQSPTETTYSNTQPLELVVSQPQHIEPYMNISKGHNVFVCENDIVKESSDPTYFCLESTGVNPESEETTIGQSHESPHDVTTANKVYNKLGEQSRQFNNPYNSLSNKDALVTVANVDLTSDIGQSNFTTEYSLASNVN